MLIPADQREGHANLIRTFGGVASRQMGEPGFVSGLTADGRKFPIEASISKIVTPKKKLFTFILRDISQRLRAEAALRAKEADLADFFTNSPMGLLWVDPKGRILRVNRALHSMLGFNDGEMLGWPVAELHCNKDDAAELLKRLAAGQVGDSFRTLFRHKDGSFRYMLIDANGRWEDDRLVHSRWFVRDISQRINLQADLASASEKEQQRIGRELHDGLGQQIQALNFLAKMLHKDLAEASSPQSETALRLSQHIEECGKLARNLAHGLQPVSPEPEGLMIALRELAARTREMYKIACTFRCPKPVLVSNVITAGHLYRIAQEALNNAMKHGHPTRITLMLSVVGQKTVLGVKDNGKGFQHPERRSKGMGLHIMRHRADAIDGTLVIQKHPKGGTEVVCTVHQAEPGTCT
jgi:PAS domain S-box-containing protein